MKYRNCAVIIFRRLFYKSISDKLYLRILYYLIFGKKLNLKNPHTFNEKLNWLKLYGRIPRYTQMADKYQVKEIIRTETNGKLLTAKCLGTWNKAEEIDFDMLPNQFVLKCTHDSGSMIICKDKATLDYKKSIKMLSKGLQHDFYLYSREWPYKNIKRMIIAEEYLENKSGGSLQDYKFWCFNGDPKYMYITNKIGIIYENFYDMDFNPVHINHGCPRYNPEFSKPLRFNDMKQYAKSLSKGIPFVRIDFWEVNGLLYFGEFTFYDWAGLQPFSSYEQDIELGQCIHLKS